MGLRGAWLWAVVIWWGSVGHAWGSEHNPDVGINLQASKNMAQCMTNCIVQVRLINIGCNINSIKNMAQCMTNCIVQVGTK